MSEASIFHPDVSHKRDTPDLPNDQINPIRKTIKRDWSLYLLLIPATLLIIFLRIYPFWGASIAFVRYNPVAGVGGSQFVGLKNFIDVFHRPEIVNLIRNTIVISLGKITLEEIFGLAFAILVYEVRFRAFKKVIQTIATFPHFFSWVIIGTLALSLLGANGMVNQALEVMGIHSLRFLGDKNIFPFSLIFTDVWKEFGWSAVIYLAALTQINPELIEAAAVDGAGRWARLWYIILPVVFPTFIFMVTLGLGGLLDAGFDQVLVLYNPAVYSTGDILDTYVYRMGLINFKFEIATVVGMIKAIVGYIAIISANWVSGKITNLRMF